MKSDRRNFLKISGLTGIGLIGSAHLEGSNYYSEKSHKSSLNHIKKEAEKRYPHIFNMSGYAAPKLETVRIGFIGLGGRGSAAVTRLSYLEGVEIKGLMVIYILPTGLDQLPRL